MGKKNKNKALGKGIHALIRRSETESREEPDIGKFENYPGRNLEFYGSLLKKYISGGGKDPLIEQLLSDTREHLDISKEEHLKLLKTLRKREKVPKKSKPDENWDKVQKDIRNELTQLFEEFKSTSDGENEIKKKKTPWKEKEDKKDIIEEPGSLAMPSPTEDDKDTKAKRKPGMVKKRLRRKVKRPSETERITDLPQGIKVVGKEHETKPIEVPPSESEKDLSETGEITEENEKLGVMVESESEVEILQNRKEKGESKETEKSTPETREEMEPSETEDIEGEMTTADEKEEEIGELEDSLTSLRMLMEDGEMERALDMANRLYEVDPYDTSILNEMGVLLYHNDDIDGAVESYQRALHIDPDSVETLINLGVLLAGNGELDESLERLDSAIEKDPQSEEAWNNKAVVLSHAGRNREALECLDESLSLNEEAPETWLNAGVVLEKMGEYGPALECYQNTLKYDPENDQAKTGIKYCRDQIG